MIHISVGLFCKKGIFKMTKYQRDLSRVFFYVWGFLSICECMCVSLQVVHTHTRRKLIKVASTVVCLYFSC